jgi:hypothetical protein
MQKVIGQEKLVTDISRIFEIFSELTPNHFQI